ncbi:hypothetical protein QVD17_28345 [Tagetes erecta]|uniref:Uncharacterized protein n=1 Tax=Tagetes erecta TaxID=13708 RepID=A0AAD8KCN7_TARER|nr:hypothetical protein QVD17_28345 [Tagetes erecta]
MLIGSPGVCLHKDAICLFSSKHQFSASVDPFNFYDTWFCYPKRASGEPAKLVAACLLSPSSGMDDKAFQ